MNINLSGFYYNIYTSKTIFKTTIYNYIHFVSTFKEETKC